MFGGVVQRGESLNLRLEGDGGAPSSGEDPGEPPRGDSTVASPADAVGRVGAGPNPRNRTGIYIVVAVVIVVGIIVAAYALGEGGHHSAAAAPGLVLVQAGIVYSLPAYSYNAISLNQNATSTVEGTITNTLGVQLYIMSPQQYWVLVKNNIVTGYEWTSGAVANDTYDHLDITIPGGPWDLAFINPYLATSTLVGFYTNLTLVSS